MDISELAEIVAQDERPATITINDKDGEPYTAGDGKTPFTMGILGSESRAYKEARNGITRASIGKKKTKVTVDYVNTNRVALAAACVAEWSRVDPSGSPVPCTHDTVSQLIGAADHILEQVEAARDSHAALFTASSPTP